MRTFARLFRKSPFGAITAHMDCVVQCIEGAHELLILFQSGERGETSRLAKRVSKLEYKADQVKNEIRNGMPRWIMFSVDRSTLLSVVSMQDSIADKAEDIAVLLTLKHLPTIPKLSKVLHEFIDANMDAFKVVVKIVKELPNLAESGFKGAESERIQVLVDQVASKEHEVDLIQRKLLKELFKNSADLSTPDFYLWARLTEEIAEISNLSENLANRIRLMLEQM
jgi:predicted phosphate transport protein (TIGR00153 family)